MRRLRTFLAALAGTVLALPQASAQSTIGRVLNPGEFTDGMEVVFEQRSGTTSKGHYLFPFRAGHYPNTGATVSSTLEVPDSIVWILVKSEIQNQVTGLDQYYIRNKATGLYLNVQFDAQNRYAYQEEDAQIWVADTASAKAFCLVSNGDATYARTYGSVKGTTSQADWDNTTYAVTYIFPANSGGRNGSGLSHSNNSGTQYGRMFLANEFEASGFNIRFYSQYQDTNVWDIREVVDAGMLNGIEDSKIVAVKQFVNVYTIDGVIVKKGVKAADAAAGLKKGVYIIGNSKVLVK